MITPRMRQRRKLLDTYVRVELEERRSASAEPPGPRNASPGWSSEDVRSEGGGASGAAQVVPRDARGAAAG